MEYQVDGIFSGTPTVSFGININNPTIQQTNIKEITIQIIKQRPLTNICVFML